MFINALTSVFVIFNGLFFASSVQASPLSQRDLIVPRIITPDASTVWTVGRVETVTWETSNFPPDSQITNPIGQIILGYQENNSLHLDFANPLASGFRLRDGEVQLTVPNVEPRDDYIIVLYGNSGNTSPTFTITRITGSSNSSASASGSSLTTSLSNSPSQTIVQSSSSPAPSPSLDSASILAYLQSSSVPSMSTSTSSATSSTASAGNSSASVASQNSGALSLWTGPAAWITCTSFIFLFSFV